jgi:hypothetical protein
MRFITNVVVYDRVACGGAFDTFVEERSFRLQTDQNIGAFRLLL